MNSVPDVLIGVERNNHKRFDDMNEVSRLTYPIRISFIKIQYNKEHVMGIKIKYKDANGKQIKGTCQLKIKLLGGVFSGTKKEKFTIPDDDIIKEIHGFVGTEINQFGFKTYKGMNHTCGVAKGVAFSHHIPFHTFLSARGTFDKFLDFIAFKVVPLTPQQLKMLGIQKPEDKIVEVQFQQQVVQPPPPMIVLSSPPPPPQQQQLLPQEQVIVSVVENVQMPASISVVPVQYYQGGEPTQYPPAWLYPPPGPGKNLAPGPYQYPPQHIEQQY